MEKKHEKKNIHLQNNTFNIWKTLSPLHNMVLLMPGATAHPCLQKYIWADEHHLWQELDEPASVGDGHLGPGGSHSEKGKENVQLE